MTNITILSHEVTAIKVETVVRITKMVMTTIMTAIEKLYTRSIYTHVYTRSIYTHTYIYTYIIIYIHIYIYTYIYIYVYMYTQICTHICIYVNRWTYPFIYIHIYIYMCVCVILFFVVFQSGVVFLAICCILELKSHICMRTWLLVFSSWFRLHLASLAAQ